MKIINHPRQMQEWRKIIPGKKSVGFVPTMGALHEGHLSLIRRSKKENDLTLVSIFVNPAQFGPKEDFSKYPRPFLRDKKLLLNLKVDVLFAPSPSNMYEENSSTRIVVSRLNDVLCGSPRSRGPEHFNGVATVVAKLFNIVNPTRVYFGLKDFQQVRIIEQMNQDLNFGIKIIRCQTLREKDGLALSSRNQYLSIAERAQAPRFYIALQEGRKLLTSTHKMSPKQVCQTIKTSLASIPNTKIDYIELVDPFTLEKKTDSTYPILIAGAIFLGKTRLIDNILVN